MKNEAMTAEQRAHWNASFAKHSRPYWNNLFRFALSLNRDRVLAEDLVQNSLMRAIKYFPSFANTHFNASDPNSLDSIFENSQSKTHLKNWLLKITKNVFLTETAALKKAESLFDTEQELESLASIIDSEQTLLNTQTSTAELPDSELSLAQSEVEFFAKASNDKLKQVIDTLNSRQRSILYLVSEGQTYKEVAETLHIPIGTVMSALSRAITKLKENLNASSFYNDEPHKLQGRHSLLRAAKQEH